MFDAHVEQLDSKFQAGVLNQLLREQLTPTPRSEISQVNEKENEVDNIPSAAVFAVEKILNKTWSHRSELHSSLSALFYLQKEFYQNLNIDEESRKLQYISKSGLVLSSDNCITTLLDDLRVNAYIRGIDQAIRAMFDKQKNIIHLVYPACGPFAPLLFPLLAYYKQKSLFTSQLKVTLIDLQAAAVKTLEALVLEMGVEEYIQDILCQDALTYQAPESSIDILVLEAMQHGFSREGHFSIAKHFSSMVCEMGYMIPEKICVSAVLNRAQREYVDQWKDADELSQQNMDLSIQAERAHLGEILSLTRQSLKDLPERALDENTTLIECGKVNIPLMPKNGDEQTLLLCTQIQVFNDEYIREYDSGISHPLPDQQVCINFVPKDDRPGDLLLKSGDGIQFFYRLNGLPGFLATWCEGENSATLKLKGAAVYD
ncbi:hypothetical protein K6Y21_06830 [Motilimonas eburnea]|nr:hypothetical protein [Motilimonas eburnea]